jgi:sugar-specific transcriptional regulator TrmB
MGMLISDTINDDAQLLTELGLTPLQAQVYLTLAQMEKATIKTVSTASKIDRANVYRIMPQLQKLNLVEKTITNPTYFKAVSVQDGITMLLDGKNREYEEIKKKTQELIERQKRENENLPEFGDCEFALVPEGKLTLRKIDQMLALTQTSYDIFCYLSDLAANIDSIYPREKRALARGVKVRQLVFAEGTHELPKELLCLKKYGAVEVRFTDVPPQSTMSIYDGKQAFVALFPYISNCKTSSLWMCNPGIVSILQNYFDVMWQNSSEQQ